MFFSTSGTGIWSNKATKIKITDIVFNTDYSEARVYFDASTWNVDVDGLIYTDPVFLKDVNAYIRTQFTGSVDYSEQGMQGDDFVSFDMDTMLTKSVLGVL